MYSPSNRTRQYSGNQRKQKSLKKIFVCDNANREAGCHKPWIWQLLTWICTMRATQFWQCPDFGNIWRSSPSLKVERFLHRNVSRKSCWLKFICQWSNFKFYRSKSASATSALSNKIFESAQEKYFTQHWLSVGSCLVFLFFHKGIAAQIIYNWQTKLINLPAASRISFINVLQSRLGQLCEWPIIDHSEVCLFRQKKNLHKSDACERGKCKNTSGKATHEYFPSMNMKLLRNIK